jgi:hypothetical protein
MSTTGDEPDNDMANLQTPITGDLPEDPTPTEGEAQVGVGDAGDLPVDPSATLGSSEETKPV